MEKFKKFIYTGFYSGLSPIAPGTCGTAVALLLYVALNIFLPAYAMAVCVALLILMIYPAIRLGDAAERHYSKEDPQQVVLDEMLGYFTAIAFHPFSWKVVILAFIFFRIFDIYKPYPVDNLQNLKGGKGILMDDIMAGVYANICIVIIKLISGKFGITI